MEFVSRDLSFLTQRSWVLDIKRHLKLQICRFMFQPRWLDNYKPNHTEKSFKIGETRKMAYYTRWAKTLIDLQIISQTSSNITFGNHFILANVLVNVKMRRLLTFINVHNPFRLAQTALAQSCFHFHTCHTKTIRCILSAHTSIYTTYVPHKKGEKSSF